MTYHTATGNAPATHVYHEANSYTARRTFSQHSRPSVPYHTSEWRFGSTYWSRLLFASRRCSSPRSLNPIHRLEADRVKTGELSSILLIGDLLAKFRTTERNISHFLTRPAQIARPVDS